MLAGLNGNAMRSTMSDTLVGQGAWSLRRHDEIPLKLQHNWRHVNVHLLSMKCVVCVIVEILFSTATNVN